jgi:NAD(P)-dependent dehydrogenase (short-subunit alcohol dehydrogenase family)
MDMFSLQGKTALVTGASRGIGEAIARTYAEAGAEVVLTARSAEALDAIAGKINADGGRAVAFAADLTDEEQIAAVVKRTVDEFGKIDVLVNNAGGTAFMSPAIDTRRTGWHKNIKLNLDSVFFLCQDVGRVMLERGNGGSVINISSVAGIGPAPLLSPYAAAKHGVIGVTRTLAVEWGHARIRVNAICPGWIKTDLNKNLWEDETHAANWVSSIPIQRWGETADLTGCALWLASDAGAYITGQAIAIDGGQRI